MNSSGLIYAVIVGAWAAYLVPMWLRRQDELNEVRPTERFGTAIRLLSGRAAMERRYAKAMRNSGSGPDDSVNPSAEAPAVPAVDPAVDVRALAIPAKRYKSKPDPHRSASGPSSAVTGPKASPKSKPDSKSKRPAARSRRAQVLARRRRTTTVLFLAFTAGSVAAGVGGLAFLWAPGVPGTLLTAYIAYLRRQERRRFEAKQAKQAKRRAAQAPQRAAARASAAPEPGYGAGQPDGSHDFADTGAVGSTHGAREARALREPERERAVEAEREARQAVVEETDHAEWVDGLRRGTVVGQDGWDQAPVPLPTYATTPVARRSTAGDDRDDPSGRRQEAALTPEGGREKEEWGARGAAPARPGRERGRTSPFGQHNSGERPRAANE